MTISFRGRANVKYFMQTKVLRFYQDTAKDFSLPLLQITTKSTHFPLSKKKTQKQPSRCVLRKRCSENMLQIYSKFTGERPCQSVISINLQRNFIKITLRHVYSPVNLLHIFREPFPKNTFGWLLLNITILWIEPQTNKLQQLSKPYI